MCTRSDFFPGRAQTGHKTSRGEKIAIRRKLFIARCIILTFGAEKPDYRLERHATLNISPGGKQNDLRRGRRVGTRASTCCREYEIL